jgi:hypothetical protein
LLLVLALAAVLLLPAAAAEHLVEEAAELRGDGVRQGKKQKGIEVHRVLCCFWW